MLKCKELLDYTLNKINRKSKSQAIIELASRILGLDEKHKTLLCLANKIDAYEYLFNEISRLENSDEILCKYLKDNKYPKPIRWGWKHLRIYEGEEELVDYCEWFEDKHECYRSMWKSMLYTAENAIDMSCEHPLTVTSKSDEWFKLDSNGLVNLFTILANCVGVIDSSFRGEVLLKFKPLLGVYDRYGESTRYAVYAESNNMFRVGERVGQIIIMPYPRVQLIEVQELSKTERGEGGFGSSGK